MGRFADLATKLAAEIPGNGKTEEGNEKNYVTLAILEMADVVECGGNLTSVLRFPNEHVQEFLFRIYCEERSDLYDMLGEQPASLREAINAELYNNQPIDGFTEDQKNIFDAFKFIEKTTLSYDLGPVAIIAIN